jgi:hypothetical protein
VHYLVRELAVASHPEKRLTLNPNMNIVALIVHYSRSSNVFAPSIRREETFPRIFLEGIPTNGAIYAYRPGRKPAILVEIAKPREV